MNYDSFRLKADQDHINAFAEVERTTGRELAYNVMDFYPSDHKKDLIESLDKLSCVVDEEAGGIIAYAIGSENAVLIAQALLHYRKFVETEPDPESLEGIKAKLEEEYSFDEEHEDYSREDWIEAVSNRETSQGYWECVAEHLQQI